MKFPSVVNIVGVPWRVDLVDQDSDEGRTIRARSRSGQSDAMHRRICVLDIGSPEDRLNTLLHEMTHAINSIMNTWDDDDEEHVCRWASIWADTLIRNGIVDP